MHTAAAVGNKLRAVTTRGAHVSLPLPLPSSHFGHSPPTLPRLFPEASSHSRAPYRRRQHARVKDDQAPRSDACRSAPPPSLSASDQTRTFNTTAPELGALGPFLRGHVRPQSSIGENSSGAATTGKWHMSLLNPAPSSASKLPIRLRAHDSPL